MIMTSEKSLLELVEEEKAKSYKNNTCIICTHPDVNMINDMLSDTSDNRVPYTLISRALEKSGVYGDKSENSIYEYLGKHKRSHMEKTK